MWVAPGSRGKGVGVALIEQVARRAGDLGIAAVYLHVNVSNAPAIALHERCGFTKTGVTLPMERDLR